MKKIQKIAVLVSQFNQDITEALYQGAYDILNKQKDYLIERVNLPGAFELPIVAKTLLLQPNYSGAVTLGAVIRGETSHFDYICQATAQGVMQVSLTTNKPITFGVITADNYAQAKARAGNINLQQKTDKSLGQHTTNIGADAAQALLTILPYFANSQV